MFVCTDTDSSQCDVPRTDTKIGRELLLEKTSDNNVTGIIYARGSINGEYELAGINDDTRGRRNSHFRDPRGRNVRRNH